MITQVDALLKLYLPPVLACIGTFGNILSLVVMSKRIFKNSTNNYLAVIAVMDMLVLYIGLLRMWIENFTIGIEAASSCMCKMANFLGHASSDTSVWLICAVTIERVLVVQYPIKAKLLCNIRRTRTIIACIIILMCVVNAHLAWTTELRYVQLSNTAVVGNCNTSGSAKFIWPWCDALIYSFAPSVVILVCNSLIIRKTMAATRRRSRMQNYELDTNVSVSLHGKRASTQKYNINLTVSLLAISFTFLLTTSPIIVLHIVSACFPDLAVNNKQLAELHLLRTIFELLMYSNHSINFFIYYAIGSKFRRKLHNMLGRCCKRHYNTFPILPTHRASTTANTGRTLSIQTTCLELTRL